MFQYKRMTCLISAENTWVFRSPGDFKASRNGLMVKKGSFFCPSPETIKNGVEKAFGKLTMVSFTDAAKIESFNNKFESQFRNIYYVYSNRIVCDTPEAFIDGAVFEKAREGK